MRDVFSAESSSWTSLDLDERTRGYWRHLTGICPNRNYSSCHVITIRSTWTHAARSQFSNLTFRGLGNWSTLALKTYDHQGNAKRTGGDSWFLLFQDSGRRVPTRVFDEGDGTYTVVANFLFPGFYHLTGWLYYSNCHGLQEPHENHENADLKRNRLDVYYTKALKKHDHCWIGERIRRTGLVEIKASHHQPPSCLHSSQCQETQHILKLDRNQPGHVFRMESYSHRVNRSTELAPCCRPRLPAPLKPFERLLFFGDSTVRNSWLMMMFLARRPCRPSFQPRTLFEPFGVTICPLAPMSEVDPQFDQILKKCTGGLPWSTVPVGTNNFDVSRHVQLPMGKSMLFDMSANWTYNDTYAKNHIPPVALPLPREFTFIYLDGKGNWDGDDLWSYTFEGKVRSTDMIVLNLGSWHLWNGKT